MAAHDCIDSELDSWLFPIEFPRPSANEYPKNGLNVGGCRNVLYELGLKKKLNSAGDTQLREHWGGPSNGRAKKKKAPR